MLGFPRSRAVFGGPVRSCLVPCGRVRPSAVVRDRVRSCAISCGREQILLILCYNLLSPGMSRTATEDGGSARGSVERSADRYRTGVRLRAAPRCGPGLQQYAFAAAAPDPESSFK